jgi:hypothetical protein
MSRETLVECLEICSGGIPRDMEYLEICSGGIPRDSALIGCLEIMPDRKYQRVVF